MTGQADTSLPQPLGEDVWTLEARFTSLGLPLSTRSTVVRLLDGGLAVVNPGPLTPSVARAVERLGHPVILLAANRFHHLFAGQWKTVWPRARLWAAPGLREKRPDLPVDAVLGEGASPWQSVLRPLPLRGCPALSEWWFFSPASRTLIVTDLLMRVGEGQPWFLRAWGAVNGSHGGRVATPRWIRAALVRDKNTLGRDAEAALALAPERLVVAHGDPLTTGVPEALEHGLRWLLQGKMQA